MPYHNPCNECIVKAACTEMCNAKTEYTDELINKLTDLSDHIYTKEGYRKSNVPAHIKRWYERAIEACDKNSEECNKIIDRYVSIGVHKYL